MLEIIVFHAIDKCWLGKGVFHQQGDPNMLVSYFFILEVSEQLSSVFDLYLRRRRKVIEQGRLGFDLQDVFYQPYRWSKAR